MSLEIPINHSCHIKCPACGHKFLYEFKIKDINKINSSKSSNKEEIVYDFETYLICKNPLCNYDMTLRGVIFEYPINQLKSIDIKVK